MQVICVPLQNRVAVLDMNSPVVCFKMAAAARTVWSVVRPHVPSIKFPPRNMKDTTGVNVSLNSGVAIPSPPPSTPVSDSKSIGYIPRGSGMEYIDLPLKYHRQKISTEEIEYIERGGPE